MFEALTKFLLAYAIGNLMGGQIVGWLRGGIDLRRLGSGNVGATNALRTQGAGFALSVLLIDVLKGVIAARLVPMIPWPLGVGAGLPREWLGYLCGVGVALGHCYPVTLGFRGGKGVATLAGVFGALMIAALPWMLLVFALVVMISGYVSAATIGAAITVLFYAIVIDAHPLHTAPVIFTIAMSLLVLFKHRQNIRRLWCGDEHRFEKARVLGRLIDRRSDL
ncbi:MAG: plsY [Hydrocarboniphaga sp.]|uniref:glycerol-3-phosphate 1-O-acyltransferase PlsY n=1 Tax=Hydrocarboniphaga sp. TaxID=2033016 RepID=UPI002635179B|nr:glycerol-3-phosphate 1-O-acyltransferase PlsY [Hydrocarboniphaga sp.]MDB5972870.1 plsY [Hydrocarboniphaga sp.]